MAGMGHFLRHPRRLARALAQDPLSLWDTFQERLIERREYARPQPRYAADAQWAAHLHEAMRAPYPCGELAELELLWRRIVADVTAQGIAVGPQSFAGYNDGDAALVRAIWCLVRHLKPNAVVETGVGHGFTSRVILEALARNRQGHLYSIDRVPLDPAMRSRIGIAVTPELAGRWTLLSGTSRRRLPAILRQLGSIELFVHDSRHTEQNVVFELTQVWPRLAPAGALVVDDVDSNWGFDSFLRNVPGEPHFIADAEPERPDERRFNRRGQFAVILKRPHLA